METMYSITIQTHVDLREMVQTTGRDKEVTCDETQLLNIYYVGYRNIQADVCALQVM